MTAGSPPQHRKLKALCVFCGSNAGTDPAFSAAAAALGTALARHGTTLVFGGGRVGLMGTVADATLAGRGSVIGVIPEFLRDKELAHPNVTNMIVVPDMHSRKRAMADRSDAFCILPGGVGTLDEAFEIVTWRQLHLHNKPIILVDAGGYWSDLIAQLGRMAAMGFSHHGHGALMTVVAGGEDVIPAVERELAAPKPPVAFPSFSST